VRPAVALVTARAARGLDEDMPPLLAAFAAAGAHAEIVDWDDASADWSRFDAALLRSAWDYTERLGEFLAWVERAAARTRLLNPVPVVRWNSDKHYLNALADAGAAVVASQFIEPVEEDPAAVLARFIGAHEAGEFVVKPAVGAGSRDTRRHARAQQAQMLEHMRPLLRARRAMLVQPYLESVGSHGETALIYIAGEFSHAIRKGPLLPSGGAATQALFAAEEITPRRPAEDELALARRIFASLPFGPLLYARVDLVRDARGIPRVLELELTEPSLYFARGPGSAARFADAALARVTGPQS
jgi:glutathione synthase/RimK-type ligase-like ATP-grasp enzyme